MRSEFQFPHVTNLSAINIVELLKACAIRKDLAKGSHLHAYIQEHGFLEKNSYVASTLVNMYAKCGALAKAQQILRGLPVRDVVIWSALISGYTQHGYGKEALTCYDNMLHEGHPPDAIIFTCALKACGSIGAADKGKQIHEKIISLGMLEKDIVLGNTLVDMYARCGALANAAEVLEELHVRDVVTWNALIAGFAQHGQGEEALNYYDNMQHEGLSPDVVTFICALKAASTIGAATKGEQIHNDIVSLGMLQKDIGLGNSLVDMYAKCGAFGKAARVLKELRLQDVVTWNAMIAGYVQQGQAEEALKCYDTLQCEGLSPDAITFTCALKACASIGATVKGEQIHDRIVRLRMLEKDAVLGNALMDMYAKCGALLKAQKLLEELPICNVVAWNALMLGYIQHGCGEEALKCYHAMQCEGHFPDVVTFICALKACGSIGAAAKGKQIHDKILSLGFLEKDIALGNALVDMYAKCGALDRAHQVLQEFPFRDVVTWSALIAGYAQQGHGEEALECYDNMQQEGHSPNVVTFNCLLKACGDIGAAAKGEKFHDKIVNLNMLQKNSVLASTLIDMYARCGAVSKAQQVLEKLPVQNVVAWNALIVGYVQQGQGEQSLNCFDYMQRDGHTPDVVTFVYALKACGSIGAAAKGKWIHDMIVSLGMLDKNIELESALVDMYVKCAALGKALKIFEKLPVQNVITWNALIGGYAQQGQCSDSFICFDKMLSKGVKPDSTTFICLLNACSHAGLLDQAEMFFSRMRTKYGMEPNVEHYSCIGDMFGRAGKFQAALLVIDKMPFAEYLPVWLSLLGACCQWREVKIARLAFEHAFYLDKSNLAVYVCMVKIYKEVGM